MPTCAPARRCGIPTPTRPRRVCAPGTRSSTPRPSRGRRSPIGAGPDHGADPRTGSSGFRPSATRRMARRWGRGSPPRGGRGVLEPGRRAPVSARRHPTAPLSELGHLDAQAARTRMMHTVYVASHAVALSLDLHIRELQHRVDARRHRSSAGDSTVHARAARDLATSIERLAGTYLDSRWPVALTGEQRRTPHRGPSSAGDCSLGGAGPSVPRG